jgi:hypothetical protein
MILTASAGTLVFDFANIIFRIELPALNKCNTYSSPVIIDNRTLFSERKVYEVHSKNMLFELGSKEYNVRSMFMYRMNTTTTYQILLELLYHSQEQNRSMKVHN